MSGTYGEPPSLHLRGWLKRFDLDYAQLSVAQADVLAGSGRPSRGHWTDGLPYVRRVNPHDGSA